MPEPQPPSANETGRATFATTHWTVVLAAGQSALPALERLCQTYWRPIYEFVRRQGYSVEEAQDLTQGFFERLLQRGDLQNVRREKGRFRSYLLVSLKNFVANEWNRAHAEKRGGVRTLISLEELQEEEKLPFEPVDERTAEKLFERRWAWALLEQVLGRLGNEFAGNRHVFDEWKQTLNDEPQPSQAEIASRLGINENALKQAFHRLRERYRELLREEVANTVSEPGELEDELRHLVAVLRH
jgi:RNA polymerase sigma-70 factor (ECF subfamily)